jgi:hypothetical protein
MNMKESRNVGCPVAATVPLLRGWAPPDDLPEETVAANPTYSRHPSAGMATARGVKGSQVALGSIHWPLSTGGLYGAVATTGMPPALNPGLKPLARIFRSFEALS